MINWTYINEEVTEIDDFPDQTYGFVYVITHLPTGKKYIGKKILYCQDCNFFIMNNLQEIYK